MAITINTSIPAYQKAPFSAFDATSQYNPSGLRDIAGALRSASGAADQVVTQLGREKKQAAIDEQDRLEDEEKAREDAQKAREKAQKEQKKLADDAERVRINQAKNINKLELARLNAGLDAAVKSEDQDKVFEAYSAIADYKNNYNQESFFGKDYQPSDTTTFGIAVDDLKSDIEMAYVTAGGKVNAFTVVTASAELLKGSENTTSSIVSNTVEIGANLEEAAAYINSQEAILNGEGFAAVPDNIKPKIVEGVFNDVLTFFDHQINTAKTVDQLQERKILSDAVFQNYEALLQSDDSAKKIVALEEQYAKKLEKLSDITEQENEAKEALKKINTGIPSDGTVNGLTLFGYELARGIDQANVLINAVSDSSKQKELLDSIVPLETLASYLLPLDSKEGDLFSISPIVVDVISLISDSDLTADDIIQQKAIEFPETWGKISAGQRTTLTATIESLTEKAKKMETNFSSLRAIFPELDTALSEDRISDAKAIYDQIVSGFKSVKGQNAIFDQFGISDIAEFAVETSGKSVDIGSQASLNTAIAKDIEKIKMTEGVATSGTFNQIMFNIRDGKYTPNSSEEIYNYALAISLSKGYDEEETASLVATIVRSGLNASPEAQRLYDAAKESYLDVGTDRRQHRIDVVQKAEEDTGSVHLNRLNNIYALGVIQNTIDYKKADDPIVSVLDLSKAINEDLNIRDPQAMTQTRIRQSVVGQTVEIPSPANLGDVVDFRLEDVSLLSALGNIVGRYVLPQAFKNKFAPHEFAEFSSMAYATHVWDKYETEDLNPFIFREDKTRGATEDGLYDWIAYAQDEGREQKEAFIDQLAWVYGQSTAEVDENPLIQWKIMTKSGEDRAYLYRLNETTNEYELKKARNKETGELEFISAPVSLAVNQGKYFLNNPNQKIPSDGILLPQSRTLGGFVNELGDIISSPRQRTEQYLLLHNQVFKNMTF